MFIFIPFSDECNNILCKIINVTIEKIVFGCFSVNYIAYSVNYINTESKCALFVCISIVTSLLKIDTEVLFTNFL